VALAKVDGSEQAQSSQREVDAEGQRVHKPVDRRGKHAIGALEGEDDDDGVGVGAELLLIVSRRLESNRIFLEVL
jgi:hypothetical protein